MNAFHDSDPASERAREAFLMKLIRKGKWDFHHDWRSDNFGNSEGSQGVIELGGRYYVVQLDESCREARGEFGSLMEALKSKEGEGLGWLNHCTGSIRCDALTLEQLWEVCGYDPGLGDAVDPCAGQTLTLNDVTLAWDWNYGLARPSAVAPFSPSEAEAIAFEDEQPGVQVVDRGPTKIFEWKDWFWLQSPDSDYELVQRGFPTLAEARFARGDAQDLLTLTWVTWLLGDEEERDELLRYRRTEDGEVELLSAGDLSAELSKSLGKRRPRPWESPLEVATALLSDYVFHLLCSPFGPVRLLCQKGGALTHQRGKKLIAAALERRQQEEEAARAKPSRIVETARRLGISVEPSGHSADAWLGRCPVHHLHPLMIDAKTEQFGCGYCRKRGGPEELEAWVESLRRKKTSPGRRRGRR